MNMIISYRDQPIDFNVRSIDCGMEHSVMEQLQVVF